MFRHINYVFLAFPLLFYIFLAFQFIPPFVWPNVHGKFVQLINFSFFWERRRATTPAPSLVHAPMYRAVARRDNWGGGVYSYIHACSHQFTYRKNNRLVTFYNIDTLIGQFNCKS
jgi:hypothetical protein